MCLLILLACVFACLPNAWEVTRRFSIVCDLKLFSLVNRSAMDRSFVFPMFIWDVEGHRIGRYEWLIVLDLSSSNRKSSYIVFFHELLSMLRFDPAAYTPLLSRRHALSSWGCAFRFHPAGSSMKPRYHALVILPCHREAMLQTPTGSSLRLACTWPQHYIGHENPDGLPHQTPSTYEKLLTSKLAPTIFATGSEPKTLLKTFFSPFTFFPSYTMYNPGPGIKFFFWPLLPSVTWDGEFLSSFFPLPPYARIGGFCLLVPLPLYPVTMEMHPRWVTTIKTSRFGNSKRREPLPTG